MDLHSRWLALFILLLLAHYTSPSLARRHRHKHGRDKRQHTPETYVLNVQGPESGDWGPWSAPAPCSRSCGGGVSHQTRQCREDSREPCVGATKRYFSCNIQDCPEGSIDFRAEQCSNFNRIPFDDVYYKWVPYMNAPNKCALNCMPKGERFYYRHRDQVVDGTPCNDESLDVCVDGKCLPVGCDHLLGSSAREDQCRECGGDGSSCNTVRGVLDTDDLQVGYNDLLLIPAGATNIRVEETKPSNNYIAIRNLTGHYYLNGNWRIDYPRSIKACGTIFHYEKPRGFVASELITALGPITEPIYIVLLYQESNPGISYEYSIPKGAVQDTDPDGYSWVYNDFGPCSATCGGGLQTRDVWCAKRRDSSEVSRDLCNEALEPPSHQECAPEPCAPQWTVGDWGPCSQTCGSGGTQTRQVVCEQIISGGRGSLVPSSTCEDTLGPPPPTSQLCPDGPPCPTWHVGPWKPCDRLCGDGHQRREVICHRRVNGRIEKMVDGACPGEKPDTELPCNLRPCEGVDWVTTEWSGCEDKCGLAFETRQAFCTTEKGELYPDSFCQKRPIPELKKECKATAACKHEWFASQWSECSAQCGPGLQTRKVFCGSFTDEGVEKADDSKCDAALKYEDSKNCTGEEECKGNWFAGPWSSCSKPCGGGLRTRKVLCMLNNMTVPQTQCNMNELLFGNDNCNNFPCGTDQIITVAPEQKVYEDYDDEEECDEDYYDDEFASTEGVQVYSSEFESSGSSSGQTPGADLSSPSSDIMLSDGTSDGLSDSTLVVTFGSSDLTEGSGSSSSLWSTEFEGSGESFPSTEPSATSSTYSSSDLSSEVSPTLSAEISSSAVSDISSESTLLPTDFTSLSSESVFSESTSNSQSSSSESSTEVSESSSDIPTESSSVETSTLISVSSSSSDVSSELTENSESASPTESTSDVPTDSTSDISSESTSEISTESTSEISTESTSEISTDSSSEISSDSSSDISSDSSSEMSSESTLEVSSSSDSSSLSSELLSSTTETLSSDISSSESGLSTSKKLRLTDQDNDDSLDIVTDTESTSLEYTSGLSSPTTDSVTETSYSSEESSEALSSTVEDISDMSSSSTEVTEGSTITPESSSVSLTESSTITSDLSTITSDSSTITSDLSTEITSESSTVSSETSPSSLLSTEESLYSVTSPSYGASTTELISIFSPELTTKSKKKRKCKRKSKKRSACLTSEFGCCYDNVTAAEGPFNKGCPIVETCKDTKYGCCVDGVSPAFGPEYKGCPPSQCNLTLFGCCPDGITASEGNDFEGCPEEPTTPFDCSGTEFGCCPDGQTAATGPDLAGCVECEGSGDCEMCNMTKYGCCPDGIQPAYGPDFEGCDIFSTTEESVTIEPENTTDCENSTFGCCPDGIIAADGPDFEGCEDREGPTPCEETTYGCCSDGNTTATGPNYQGCVAECEGQPFGCCQDRITPAHGPNKEGCCLLESFGCCPDNILPAQGPNLEGCGCQYTTYGCCPDNQTTARGPDLQGCGCQYTPHGCCPNQYTPAAGPGYQGCPCHTYQFGCCPDGVTRAIGPNLQGCGCEHTEFGCCPDGHTPAPGPDQTCPCVASTHGCCPDGVSEALGEHFEGCENIPLAPGEVCTLQKDRGPCREFTVRWFYDTEYGGCSRFWYGGCEGNENRFKTQDECKETCVEPPDRAKCFLPKIAGPCEGYNPTWYYDTERKQCGQFVYGGCLGNGNKFETRESCEELCVTPDTVDACEKPVDEGPCQGNFTMWFYDKESGTCSTFNYGGCRGNNNRFLTELACQQKCLQPGRSRVIDVCGLEKDPGPCPGTIMRWYYNADTDTCNQFVYGGCQGNANRFRSETECVRRCIDFMPDECALPRAQGSCSEKLPRWFFDASENRCMPFYYSGCEGNNNRFETREVCEQTCPSKIEQHTCLLPALVGECHNYTARWYYDSLEGQCRQFYYGGCGGNNNNFQEQEDCRRSCDHGYVPPPPPPRQPDLTTSAPDLPFTPDMCFLPDAAGDCDQAIAQWFYDSRDGVCKQFIYTGCRGNGNRYNTQQECESRCRNVQDPCTLPRVVGPCDGYEPQYYYDQSSDTCHPFDYGGCQGNANRFPSQTDCEERCQRARPALTTTAPAPPRKSDICYLPFDQGPCNDQVPAWFFDPTSGQCQAFLYGGCNGNANRFLSIEQCERQCGQFLGQDVCNVPVDVGPCVQHLNKWYFDSPTRSCQEFHYGGCEGSANRFSSLPECESVCLHREELIPQSNTSLSYLAICKLPVDAGPCLDGEFTRWAFDEQQQTCVAFTYHGCAGNLNRFKSFKACLDYCLPGHSTNTSGLPNVIDVDTDTGVEKDKCSDVQLECARLTQCPYGVERWVDAEGCENCRCYNPCVAQSPQCPANTSCAVTLITHPDTQQTEYRAVCRQLYKTGECPQLSADNSHCTQECQVDADCSGSAKCCATGCGTACLEPASDIVQTAAPDTYQPGSSAPEIYSDTPEVEADEGYFVTLRCLARGNPTPSIYWIRGGSTLSVAGGRYKFLSEGSLQIVGLAQTDAGEYICVADNGIGDPARKSFHVRVRGAKERPAEVLGDDSQSVVVSLGSRAVLQCYAYGFPAPSVTWWRGERMLPLISAELEQRRDLSLVLHAVTLTSLGPYTCQAYNGLGRAASWTVTLKAVGPVHSFDPNDVTYNQYLVPPPRPDHQPHPPPYRPLPPRVQPTQPPAPTAVTPRIFIVPVKTNISMDKTTFPVDSDISIPCDVDGYPVPKVVWYKDNQLLQSSDKFVISESSRLTVVRASVSDAGTYKCEAANPFSSSYSEVNISIEGIYVDPLCTDNTFFANCHLVVKGKYCTHKYYGKFCCKSCTLAGQLPSHGPHLEALKRRRRSLVTR